MIHRWRRGVVLAAVGATIVAGVLLATQPWSGETLVREAAGGTIVQRACDVVMDIPPRGQGPDIVTVRPSEPSLKGQLRGPVMVLGVRGSGTNTAEVLINALTGTVLEERYQAPSVEATALQVLQTMRVEPLDPSRAPWPYTDTAQVSTARVGEKGTFQYRFPDPGSGLMISGSGMDGIGWYALGLRMENCRSLLEILVTFRPGTEPEVKVTKDIHPDDEAAFQTFLDEVEVKGLDQ